MQSTGDGIFATFGAPLAHEEHPQRALHAALTMQEELNRYSDGLRAEGRKPVQARAPIGSVAVTDQTKKLCDGYFNFKSLGAARISGVSEPVDVYELTGLGPMRTHFQLSAERGLAKFVGRQ